MAARASLDTYIKTQVDQVGHATADSADLTFTACDPSNGNTVTITGKELVHVRNDHGSLAKTVTFTLKTDEYGRAGAVTAYSLAASEQAVFGPFPLAAWAQSTANDLYINGESTDIKLAIVRYP